MPMATERRGWSRRAWLASACVAPLAHARPPAPRLLAAWDDLRLGTRQVGVLALSPQAQVLHAIDVPTRAHGVLVADDGSCIAVARRPGDWLLRWRPAPRPGVQWCWADGGRVFNGHARVHAGRLFTTETDLETGQGVVAVRVLDTLRVHALWPTHGPDPHDLRFDAQGRLWVANGGIATDPSTGRTKDTRAMDSSLVCLSAHDGTLHGQWRLPDAKLSLRHLALGSDGRIGIALQAEHDDAAQRRSAPLLAVWHAGRLRAVEGAPAEGYAGDIAALGDAFVVSATRAGRVLAWEARHAWRTLADTPEPCALATAQQRVWCGSPQRWQQPGVALASAPGLRFDNHAAAA
jgi:hypothetical protein